MWLAHELDPSKRAGILAEYVEIHGPVDPPLLTQAWREVCAETDAWRVRFVGGEGEPAQTIAETALSSPSLIDVSTRISPEAAAEEWMRTDLAQPTDLANGPVATFAILKVADDRYFWYQRFHHIMIDYYGVVLCTRRLAEVYTALATGMPYERRRLGRLRPFLDEQAAYGRSADFDLDREYWLRQLANRPEPSTLGGSGSETADVNLIRSTFVPDPVLAAMRDVAQRAGTTWPRLVMAATAAYLHRTTGERDVVLGLPVACRTTSSARRTPSLAANVVPLRLQVCPDMSSLELIEQVSRVVEETLPHQRYRYEDLRRDLGVLGGGRRFLGPTVNVMSFEDDLRFAGHPTTRHNLANGPVEDLSIFAFKRSDGRGVQFDFTANPQGYRSEDLAAHQRGFVRLLRAALVEPRQPIATLELLTEPERQRVLVEWNSTTRIVPQATLPALFEDQVARTPEATALVFEGARMSYADLNARANGLAHRLVRAGIGPDHVVALASGRSVELVVGLLGIMKAGAAYLPIDTEYPAARIAFMLTDAQPSCLLATDAIAQRLDAVTDSGGVPVVVLDQIEATDISGRSHHRNPTDADRLRPLCLGSPAYVIYTSGSTGTPKGVVVSHAGLSSLAATQIDRLAIGPGSRVLQFASPGFDAAVAEIVTALLSGAALVIAPPDRLMPGEPLTALVRAAGVTHTTIPPTVLAGMSVADLPRTVTLVVAGERCPRELVARWSPGRRMINAYGPTEVTVCATMSEPLSPAEQDPPIGRPIANTQAYVLDSALSPVAPGVVGQLYVAGRGVAQGYLGQPALTAQRFVPNPYGLPGSRMYRTGDLTRWRHDGTLEFVGRVDDQVKLRGFRVEPREVEAALVRNETVAQAVVVVREDRPGDRRLVAYVVPVPGHDADDVALRRFAGRWLPEYMIPSAVVVLERLPLTPNGKLDRRALPRPSTGSRGGRAPRTALEHTLCRLFAEVLGVSDVGLDDNFFDLGGHSLLAVQLVSRLRQTLPAELSAHSVLQAPTVADLVERFAGTDPPDQREVLLPIWTSGSRPPLFCLHPAVGLAWCYSGLRAQLGPDQPIYGVQARRTEVLPETVHQMANAYLDQIRRVQPTGPYHLLGWSFGGHVAHTLATILQHQGEHVGLLAVLDAYPHDQRLPDNRSSGSKMLSGMLEGLVDLDDETRAALTRTARNNMRLAANHVPDRYDGDLLFFTAAHGRTRNFPSAQAWRPYVTGRIDNHEIHCGHFEMTDRDPLTAIGAVLADRLAALGAAPNAVGSGR
jgi:amino acid adenylation domain-containing protein